MASRKMYEAVAQVVRDNLDLPPQDSKTALSQVAQDLADVFKADNPNFRYDAFYEACGLTAWGVVAA